MKSGRVIGTFFDRRDFFAQKVPSFNMEGQDRVGTSIGCIFSTIMAVCIIMYGGYKTLICFSRLNPNVSEVVLENYYSDKFSVDL